MAWTDRHEHCSAEGWYGAQNLQIQFDKEQWCWGMQCRGRCNGLAIKNSMILMLQTNWFHYIDIKHCLTRSPNGLYLLTALQDRKISIPIKTNPKSICTLIVSNVQVNNKYFAVGNQSLRLGNCACTSSEWKLANFIYIWQQFSTKEKKKMKRTSIGQVVITKSKKY